MSLSSLYLDAFAAVAREQSFSLAAKNLYVTQSALSQRVLNLEQELGSSLFIRESSGIRLTELGQKLLHYCQSKERLEAEFLSYLQPELAGALSGIIRVGAFSTIAHSAVLPLLSKLMQDHSSLQLELKIEELRDLPPLLTSGGTDFIFGIRPLEKQGVENHLVGYEENVLVQSSSKKVIPDIYLDHDSEDTTTFDFFKKQGRASFSLKRSYLGNIDAIIEGVRLGIGKAVVPRHLIQSDKSISIIKNHKPLKIPIYLTYYSQAFYTKLQTEVMESLRHQIAGFL